MRKERKRKDREVRKKKPWWLPLGDDYLPGALPSDKYWPGMTDEECKALGVKPHLLGFGFGR